MQHHHNRVGDVHDIQLGLTDAHRFEDQRCEPGDVERRQHRVSSWAEPAELTPGGERPHEHVRVVGVTLHPYPVTQDGTPRERARRVDQNEARSGTLGPVVGDELVHQGALSGPWRPGDPDYVSTGSKFGQPFDQIGRGSLDDFGDQSAERPPVPGE